MTASSPSTAPRSSACATGSQAWSHEASPIGEGVRSLKPRRNHSEEETSMTVQSASEQITEAVTAWPGVTAGPGSRGEFAFRLGGREIGHLHGNSAAHFSFTK